MAHVSRHADVRGGHRASHTGGRMVVGFLLVIWGALALLDNLGLVEFRHLWRNFWPLIMVAWGASRLIYGRGDGRWVGAAAMAMGFVFLGNRLLGWHVSVGALWPVVLIVFGASLLLRRSSRHGVHVQVHVQRPPGAASGSPDDAPPSPTDGAPAAGASERSEDSGATLREFALLGGVERRNTSQTFRGGEVTAVLGGVQLDLSDSRMAGDVAHVEVMACMGGIAFRIPRDWVVESRVVAILGGFDDKSLPPVDGTPVKRLVVTGQAVLGGIEIKN